MRPQPDGSVNVDGSVPIRDLNRAMDWDLPDEEATTVAGLVIHEARIIPEPGQAFTFHGFRFQVLRESRNRITALKITPVPSRGRGRGSEAEAGGDGVLNDKTLALGALGIVYGDIGTSPLYTFKTALEWAGGGDASCRAWHPLAHRVDADHHHVAQIRRHRHAGR